MPVCFGQDDHSTEQRCCCPLGYIESNDGNYSDSIHEGECNGQIDARKSQGSQESLVTGRTAGMELAESLYCIEVLETFVNITGPKETPFMSATPRRRSV